MNPTIQTLSNVSPSDLQVKSDVRRLKGIPALVSMLDNPNREVRLAFPEWFMISA